MELAAPSTQVMTWQGSKVFAKFLSTAILANFGQNNNIGVKMLLPRCQSTQLTFPTDIGRELKHQKGERNEEWRRNNNQVI